MMIGNWDYFRVMILWVVQMYLKIDVIRQIIGWSTNTRKKWSDLNSTFWTHPKKMQGVPKKCGGDHDFFTPLFSAFKLLNRKSRRWLLKCMMIGLDWFMILCCTDELGGWCHSSNYRVVYEHPKKWRDLAPLWRHPKNVEGISTLSFHFFRLSSSYAIENHVTPEILDDWLL